MLQALKHLMQVLKANPEDAQAISLAIDAVAASSDDHLANQLIEFLLGETDGMPKVSTGRMQGTLEVRHPHCVGSITKNFVYYTYSRTQLYFT